MNRQNNFENQGNPNNDTLRLLRECDSGVKMGVSTIEDILDDVQSSDLYSTLKSSVEEHKRLEEEARKMLRELNEPDRDPPAMARGMSKMKTEFKMMTDNKDAAVADLMITGCNTGIKSLSRYLNEYPAANERARNIAKKLIAMESSLSENMRAYL